jgi:MraZ protein
VEERLSSFLGKYYYTLDQKGRIIIPAPLRDVILKTYNNSKLYITNAPFDKCLDIYPSDEWNKLGEKLRTLPQTSDSVEYFKRRVIASAVECDIDKQGRILVPYEHRQDAEINAEVVIVGMLNRIQLWDKAKWIDITDPGKIDAKTFKAELAGYGL